MSTIDKTGTGPTAGVKPFDGDGKVYVMENVIDLTGGAITQADVYQCLAIPAKTKVVEVCTEVITAAVGTTLTMDIGDGGATNGWDASVNGKTEQQNYSANGTDARAVATGNGYVYTTADSIDIVMTTATAITAGPKIKIKAWCIDYS